MTARPDLDITDLMEYYGRFIRDGGRVLYVRPPLEDESGYTESVAGETIRRVGWGPDTCSSWTVLTVFPQIIWDVNGWYRALRVPPGATRRQLRIAYIRQLGPLSSRLSYIFKQLISSKKDAAGKTIRRRYDACEFGTLFMEDTLLIEQLNRMAHAQAARMAAEGIVRTPDEVLNEMGFTRGVPPADQDDEAQSEDEAAPGGAAAPWPWAWFRRGAAGDEAAMERWQQALAGELSRRRLRIRFSVGTSRPDQAADVSPEWHEDRVVFFLREGADPSPAAAYTAVSTALRDGLVIVSGSW